MISTLRGLIIAAGLAVVLAAIAMFARVARSTPPDRALVPGFADDAVTELRWQRPGDPELAIVRDGDIWRWKPPSTARANPQVVSDVLGALRGAQWHRRAPAAQAGQLRSQLTIVTGRATRTLGIGAPLAATEQVWLVDGPHAVLVDRWVARALDPSPLDLRIRTPLDGAPGAQQIALRGVELSGHPRQLLRGDARYLVSADSARALETAIAALEITELPIASAAATTTPELTIELDELTASLGRGCNGKPELYRLATASGDGCVASARVDAVRAAVDELAPELRPVPFDLAKLTLPDGEILDLRARPMIGDVEADAARVAQLLAVLAAPATPIDKAPPPPRAKLVASSASGASITLELCGRNVVRRTGESIALQLTPEAMAILEQPAAELRSPVLWLEDPTTVSAIAIDGITYTRGAVLGEWTRIPPRPFKPADLTALAELLASPRAAGTSDGQPAIHHRVVVTISAPSGPPRQHAIELGGTTATGCPARIDGRTVVLPRELCRAVDAVLRYTETR